MWVIVEYDSYWDLDIGRVISGTEKVIGPFECEEDAEILAKNNLSNFTYSIHKLQNSV